MRTRARIKYKILRTYHGTYFPPDPWPSTDRRREGTTVLLRQSGLETRVSISGRDLKYELLLGITDDEDERARFFVHAANRSSAKIPSSTLPGPVRSPFSDRRRARSNNTCCSRHQVKRRRVTYVDHNDGDHSVRLHDTTCACRSDVDTKRTCLPNARVVDRVRLYV